MELDMTTATVTRIRVVCTTVDDFKKENRPSESVVWDGYDIRDLSVKFPPSDIFGADPLGYSQIEDGHIRTSYRFEQLMPCGTWETIDDPRVRLTPVMATERAIDAENRRDFPGDYVTEEDDYDGYDDGPYCHNCNDHGCRQCDPSSDQCTDCQQWHHLDGLNEHGRCWPCQYDYDEAVKPRCVDCREAHSDPSKQNSDPCNDCEDYWRSQYPAQCIWCHSNHEDTSLTDDDLCASCNKQVTRENHWFWRLWYYRTYYFRVRPKQRLQPLTDVVVECWVVLVREPLRSAPAVLARNWHYQVREPLQHLRSRLGNRSDR